MRKMLSTITREIQIKTTTRCLIHVGMATNQNQKQLQHMLKVRSAGQVMWKLEPLCTVDGTKIGAAAMEKGTGVPEKIKNWTSVWFSSPTSVFIQKN